LISLALAKPAMFYLSMGLYFSQNFEGVHIDHLLGELALGGQYLDLG